MRIRAVVIASGLLVLGGGAFGGCSEDEADPRGGRKGEACQSSRDCAAGLACMPAANGSGTCVVGVFNITPTGKECAVIECQTPADCCKARLTPSDCDVLLRACQTDSGFSAESCSQYRAQCVCDADSMDCRNGTCATRCLGDEVCISPSGKTGRCLAGNCAECAEDTDCSANGERTCQNGRCLAPCLGDGDCPNFDRCVGGRCTGSGCVTNRECVAATRNVEATCGRDGKCVLPCQSDLECGNPKDYAFYSCIAGQCLYVGCTSDKDCRLFLGKSDLDETTHVVCRPKPTP